MAGITLAQAEARLADWLAADEAVASGQSYTIGSRTLTRAHAQQIRENIAFWDRKVAALSNTSSGGARVRFGVPE